MAKSRRRSKGSGQQSRRQSKQQSRRQSRSAQNNGSNTQFESFLNKHPKGSLCPLYAHLSVSPRGRIACFFVTKNNSIIDISFRYNLGRMSRFIMREHEDRIEFEKKIQSEFYYSTWKPKQSAASNSTTEAIQEIQKVLFTRYPPCDSDEQVESIMDLNM